MKTLSPSFNYYSILIMKIITESNLGLKLIDSSMSWGILAQDPGDSDISKYGSSKRG